VRMGALIAAAMVVSSMSTLALLPALVTILKPSFLGIHDVEVPTLPIRPVPQPAAASPADPGVELPR